MDDLRKQVKFREPFVVPQTKTNNRLRTILIYCLAAVCGLLAIATAAYIFVLN